MLRSSLTVLVGMTLAMGACGGDDDGGGSGFKTSVPSSKRVDMLSPAETQTLCQDFSKWGESLEKSLTPKICRLAGLLAPDKASCETAVKECIDEPSEPSDGGMCEAPENCSASVGEMQACLNDTMNTLSSYLDKFPTCAQIASGSGSIPTQMPMKPASCAAIESKCPAIANGFDDIAGDEEEEEDEINQSF